MNETERQVNDFLEALTKKVNVINSELGKGIGLCCMQVQREAIKGMTETEVDTNKSYFTHNKKIAHHPSKEGNYPAVDTGTLRRSITFDVREENGKIVGRVGSTIKEPPYPFFLEFGTSKMKPRKWLQPSLEKSKDKILKILKGSIK